MIKDNNREILIHYRLNEAEQTVDEVRKLIEADFSISQMPISALAGM
jgi:hypothetical protein